MDFFQNVALKTGGTETTYTGFKGIQFQSSNNLDANESSSIFSSAISVPDGAGWKQQGSLFNLGDSTKGREELNKRLDNEVNPKYS